MTEEYMPSAFTEHFETAPPDVLYHYTGQHGLLGIVGTKELWCTKVQYMNDSTEFGLALNMARAALEKLIRELPSGDIHNSRRIACHDFLRSLDGLEEINLFAICFCENGDLLSQWRSYTGGGTGYAIEFRTETLSQVGAAKNFKLGKCIYNPGVQQTIIDQAIEHCLDDELATPPRTKWEFHGPLARILFNCGVFFKEASFAEEKEWRLVSPIIWFHDDDIGFRQGKSMVIPYYKLSIKSGNDLPNLRVVVGPCPHMQLSQRSVTALLMSNGLRGPLTGRSVAIESKVPFRDW